MFQLCGVFAEFERSIIQERIKAGLERAKAEGKTLGRKKVSLDKRTPLGVLRADGNSYHKIAKSVGVGVSVVQRVLKEAA